MGYMEHHAIVVTSWNKEIAQEAQKKAEDIGLYASPICESRTNGYCTFLIPPDGSKEGWKESNDFDAMRQVFIEWTETKRYSDNSSPIEWVEVRYSSDNLQAEVIAHGYKQAFLTNNRYNGAKMTKNDMHEALREAFEEWYSKTFVIGKSTFTAGKFNRPYDNLDVYYSWRSWQACAEHIRPKLQSEDMVERVAEAIYDCTSLYGLPFMHAPEEVRNDYMRHAQRAIAAMQVCEKAAHEEAKALVGEMVDVLSQAYECSKKGFPYIGQFSTQTLFEENADKIITKATKWLEGK